MVLPPQIRRQRPGVRVQQTTITLPGDDMEWVRKRAYARKETVSLYVRNLIQECRRRECDEPDTDTTEDAA